MFSGIDVYLHIIYSVCELEARESYEFLVSLRFFNLDARGRDSYVLVSGGMVLIMYYLVIS